MRSYHCFQEAFRGTLSDLIQDGETVGGVTSARSIGSGFKGVPRAFVELQGHGFRLLDPRRRWLVDSPRRPNAAFASANVLFALAGGHEIEMISAYNARGLQFAEDESRYEAAFGARLFSPGHQLAYVKAKLQADRQSRRGVAMIYSPEDTLLDRLDTPCAIALQFLVRNDRLDCICFMRSQSAAMVMPYDVFLFTVLHEWLALELDVELGVYTHLSGSMHFYEDERELVQSILDGAGSSPTMPSMSAAGPAVAAKLVAAERRLRLTGHRSGRGEAEGLDAYWRMFMAPLVDFHAPTLASTYFLEG